MPIQLDYDVARERFQEALKLARTEARLSQAWLERAKKVGQAPSKTFVAMMGTALLAKATDPRVDPFALKTRDFPTAYSARALCKDVLVTSAVEAGVHLGTTGREPLNNQPFFRHERVGLDMTVRPSARPHLSYLCQCLEAMKKLNRQQALEALAAFIRVRLKEGPRKQAPLQVGPVIGIPELVAHVTELVVSDPENGKRGQALVAASLDLVFKDVRTTRVFDPSRRWPGDVVVYDGDSIILAVEVKQRPATNTELLQFAERCAQMGVRRAVVATLHPDQSPLFVNELREQCWRRYAVDLSVLVDAGEVLHGGFAWSPRAIEQALTDFPQLMALRLQELEVSSEGLAAWATLFRKQG